MAKKVGVHTWVQAEEIFPNPYNSRERAPNPDYHPPIEYINGRFRYQGALKGDWLDKKDVPDYILEAAKNLPKEKVSHNHMELDLKDVMEGKPLLDENLSVLIRAKKEKELAKARKNGKAKKQSGRRNGGVRKGNPKVVQRKESDGSGPGHSDSLE